LELLVIGADVKRSNGMGGGRKGNGRGCGDEGVQPGRRDRKRVREGRETKSMQGPKREKV